jgi:hypothetical protein
MSEDNPLYEYGTQLKPSQEGIVHNSRLSERMRATFCGLSEHGDLLLWINGTWKPEKYPHKPSYWEKA